MNGNGWNGEVKCDGSELGESEGFDLIDYIWEMIGLWGWIGCGLEKG